MERYRLNPNAIVVKGACRSTICDLERCQYFTIPNFLANILSEGYFDYQGIVLGEVKFSDDEIETIASYLDFLIEQDLVFLTQNGSFYKDVKLEYYYPGQISNAILDVGEIITYDIKSCIRQLDELGCDTIQVRFFYPTTIGFIESMLKACYGSQIKNFQVIMPFSCEVTLEWMEKIELNFPRLRYIQMYGAPSEGFVYISLSQKTVVMNVKEEIHDESCCGNIHPDYFVVDMKSFTESMNYNSCLNRKISVSKEGVIKNCPSMNRGYGFASEVKLSSALQRDEFRQIYDINKDKIKVCRDCEFRHICTDCRAITTDSNDLYSKPLKCNYDPYSMIWNEDSDSVVTNFKKI